MTIEIEQQSEGAAPTVPMARSSRYFCCFFDGIFDGRLNLAT